MAKANNTAIEELLIEVKANLAGLQVERNESGITKLEHAHYNAAIMVCKDIIAKCQELKKKEGEQIDNAFNAGRNSKDYHDASHYFFMQYIDND